MGETLRRALSTLCIVTVYVSVTAFSTTRPAPTVVCGQTIVTSIVLKTDVGPCAGAGLIIGTDNITLDLGGKKVFGTADEGAGGQFVGIRLPGRSGVTVRNGVVEGFEAGVVSEDGSRNTITNLTVQDNVGPADEDADFGDGIALLNSADNRVMKNTLLRNGRFDGLAVLGDRSNGNLIQGNFIADTLSLDTSPIRGVGLLFDPFISFPAPPPTISITGNRAIANVIEGNAGSGLLSVSNVGAVIQRNVIDGNGLASEGRGIGITSLPPATKVTNAQVNANVVTDNGGPGIEIRASSSDEVSGNTVNANHGIAGIVLLGPPSDTKTNRVVRNAVHANDGSGILVKDATMNEISQNDASDNAVDSPAGTASDLRDENPGCDTNTWTANKWGNGGFSPACTANGRRARGFPPAKSP